MFLCQTKVMFQQLETKADPYNARFISESAVEREKKTIPEAFERLEKTTAAVQQSCSTLYDRLMPILGPEKPRKESDSAYPKIGVGLADRLQETTQNLNAVYEGLNVLLSRLEI